jgi:tetratricopeptide (TPR) repeat protein
VISPRRIISVVLGAALAVGVLIALRLSVFAPSRPGPAADSQTPAGRDITPKPQPVARATIPRIVIPDSPRSQPVSQPVTTQPAPRTQPAVAVVPDTFEAQLKAGKQALRKGQPAQALEYLQRANTLRPDDAAALQWLATALQANDKHAETIPLYRKLIKLHPDDTTARFNLAMALGREEKFHEAQRVYWELLDIDPDHVEAHVNLAMLYQHQCKLGDARREWEKVIHLDPKSFQAYEGLGEVLTDLGKNDQAMDAFAQAAVLQPKVASAWLNYAASATSAGAAGKAIVALDRALQLAPYDAEAWSMRGDILLELYRTTKNERHARQAVAAWKQSLELQPEQPRLRKLLNTYSRFDK